MMAMQKNRVLANPQFLALLGRPTAAPTAFVETLNQGFNFSGLLTGASVSVFTMAVSFYALKKCQKSASDTDDYTKPLL